MKLLSRFSAAARERRVRAALADLGETGAFELMRAAHVSSATVYVLLVRWKREGIVASRQQAEHEQSIIKGRQLPARRLYRLVDKRPPTPPAGWENRP